MKKVLIISYFFPPSNAIGAQRPYRLAKYFPQFGWEAIVLTPKLSGKPPEGIKIIETDYKDIVSGIKSKVGFSPEKGVHEQLGIAVSRDFNYPTWKSKIIKFAKEIVGYPDNKKGWIKFAVESASEFLSKEKVDVIISTSGPVTTHLIARKLKLKHNIPWIADFRDLWTQNPYINKFRLIKYFEKQLERKTLYDADVIIAVTKPWIYTLKLLHKNKKIFCVTNGYDEDDFPTLLPKLTKKFTITYTGQLYNGKRDPLLLFKVITKLINENKIDSELIEIRFYGYEEDWIKEDIKKHHLESVVNFYGFLPRNDVLEKQRESQILLLLLWPNKDEEGFCPGKVYEYVGARRPIVAIGASEHVVKDLLKTTNAGRYTWEPNMLEDVILEYYKEYIKFGEVKYCGNNNIEDYTYNLITNKYSEILNGLVLK